MLLRCSNNTTSVPGAQLVEWVVGLRPEESGHEHSALTRFRARRGPKKCQEVFNEIIGEGRAPGLMHDGLRILDAAHRPAKVNVLRLPTPAAGTSFREVAGY